MITKKEMVENYETYCIEAKKTIEDAIDREITSNCKNLLRKKVVEIRYLSNYSEEIDFLGDIITKYSDFTFNLEPTVKNDNWRMLTVKLND